MGEALIGLLPPVALISYIVYSMVQDSGELDEEIRLFHCRHRKFRRKHTKVKRIKQWLK